MDVTEGSDSNGDDAHEGSAWASAPSSEPTKAVPARQARMMAELLGNLFSDYYDMARRIKQGLHDPLLSSGFPVIPTVNGGIEDLSVVSPFTVDTLRQTADEVLSQSAIMKQGCDTVLSRLADDEDDEDEQPMLRPRRLR